MRNLIFLFVKHGGFVTFFFLEVFCMYLVVNNNQRQGEIYLNSLSAATDYIYDTFDEIAQFANLSTHAENLQREITRMREEAEETKYIKAITRDTAAAPESDQYFSLIGAKIINSNLKGYNNSFTIDRGANQGVKPSMGVIGSEQLGVVGIVKSVTGNFSRVMSILHRQSKVSAAVKRNHHRGTISWDGSSPLLVDFKDVPKHADLVKGDTIETSGLSTVFPGNIMIGTIDTFWLPSGSNYYEIKVRLKNDLNQIRYVHVVENLMIDEIQEIQEADE